MKKSISKMVFLLSLVLMFNTAIAEWYDGIGDTIARGLGAVAGVALGTLFTANPFVGVGAGAVGGYVGQQFWDAAYNAIAPHI